MRAGNRGRHRLRRPAGRAGKLIGTGIAGAAIVLTGQAVYLGPTSAYLSDTAEIGPFGFVYQAPGSAGEPNRLATAGDAAADTAGGGARGSGSSADGSAAGDSTGPGTDTRPGMQAGSGSDGVQTQQPQTPQPSQPPVPPAQSPQPAPQTPRPAPPEQAARTLSIVETVGEVVEPVAGPALAAVDGALGG